MDRGTRLLQRVVGRVTYAREPERVRHSLQESPAQGMRGTALGYEDLDDHEELRRDPLLGSLVGKSTLNRSELIPARVSSRLSWAGRDSETF